MLFVAKQVGERLDYTPTSNSIAAGEIVILGSLVGIATEPIPVGNPGSLALRGVFTGPKKSTDVVTVGAKLYWDSTNGHLTLTASGNTYVGKATKAAGNGVTLVDVLLCNLG